MRYLFDFSIYLRNVFVNDVAIKVVPKVAFKFEDLPGRESVEFKENHQSNFTMHISGIEQSLWVFFFPTTSKSKNEETKSCNQ